jgi:hypothetical protein
MELDPIGIEGLTKRTSDKEQQKPTGQFSKVLDKRITDHNRTMDHPPERVDDGKEKSGQKTQEKSELVNLGTLSKKARTVSDLLLKHPVYKKEIWRIIHSELNRGMPYTKMRAGTKVYLNPKSLEMVWDSSRSRRLNMAVSGPKRPAGYLLTSAEGNDKSGLKTQERSELVNLGTISKNRRTVSNLLLKHPVYKKDMWRIIHSELNRRKAYTQMRPGTEVYLNPESFEIVWGQKNNHVEPSPTLAKTDHLPSENQYGDAERTDSLSEGLVKAVAPYVGKPYAELDCYQLVVEGLQKMGVRYMGRGGLGEKLIKMAMRKGLPSNAYLNGEGLIKASGSKVYSRSIIRVQDSETQARKVYKEMEPLLKKGFILSFSTPTKGHTGIVSQKNSLWTYINSGDMDNNVEAPRETKSVGEEYLMGEIKNWLALAAERDESLVITLGQLQEEKLRNFVI